jgi:hypothetical protein
MNTSHISKYAPKARTDFIAALTKQAGKYGITENDVSSLKPEAMYANWVCAGVPVKG